MSQPAIKVEGLWKEYAIGQTQEQHNTFYDLLSHSLRAPFKQRWSRGTQVHRSEPFWALQDINFDVQPGEIVGIVGRNGAGKSTLLKILSRISAPSKGRIEVRGRLASLLEVGTGFHPELSGRENVYLNATILGMGQREIQRKFDDIVEFSGVSKFLDTPVKRYSSGMYVRLAFAVAAYVQADILLVDEVLAVGDAEFQKRCLGMMGDVARDGRTILFVSHNINALRNLCTKGLLLESGRFDSLGSINDVIAKFVSTQTHEREMAAEFPDHLDGAAARITHVSVSNKSSIGLGMITVGTTFGIKIGLEIREPDSEFGVFFSCFDENQNRVFCSGSFFEKKFNGAKLSAGMHLFECTVPGNTLNVSRYTLDVTLLRNRSEIVQEVATALAFNVSDDSETAVEGWHWPILGIVRPLLKWEKK